MPGIVKEHTNVPTGARKALSIGIQYRDAVQYSKRDAPPELESTHGDPEKVKEILTKYYGYEEEDIVIMKDDGKHTLPTRENILNAIDTLVKDAKAGDRFVFHFSGHGAQIPDENGDEADELDEVIWPVDVVFDAEKDDAVDGYIVDDELRERLVDALPAGTYLTIILDCCHSGTGVDLPHSHSDSEEELDKELYQLWSPVSPKGRSVAPFSPLSPTKGDKGRARGPLELRNSKFVRELESFEDSVKKEAEELRSRLVHEKHVTSWAACVDDTLELESTEGGMLTVAFWHVLRLNQSRTHLELYKAIAEHLIKLVKPGKKQVLDMGLGCPKPVLSSLHKLDHIYPLPFSF